MIFAKTMDTRWNYGKSEMEKGEILKRISRGSEHDKLPRSEEPNASSCHNIMTMTSDPYLAVC